MFSQFRHAVESLAPQNPRRSSHDAGADGGAARSMSPDSSGLRPSASLPVGIMAESALSSLKKSLATQRPGNSGTAHSPRSGSLGEEMKTHKSTLEDRLRAKFAIGEASNSSTPGVSARTSPAPVPVSDHPLSPASMPLPDSPAVSPPPGGELPMISPFLNSRFSHPMSKAISESSSQSSIIADATLSNDAPDRDIITSLDITTSMIHSPRPRQAAQEILSASPVTVEGRLPEADIPLPPDTPDLRDGEVEESPDHVSSDTLDQSRPVGKDIDVEALQQRLKLVEQRFTDVSTSFKRLQAEKRAVDAVLQDLTPVTGIQDAEGLREYLHSLALRAETAQDEIKRLNGKLIRQEERIEELRDTHRLESASQSEQIDRLRKQLEEVEALLKASQGSISQNEEDAAKQKAEVSRLQGELEKSYSAVKEEEEKRVKAISLLKSVRQKLVKAEKDRDDAAREATGFKEREKEDQDRERAEKLKLRQELEAANAEREKAITGLKSQFDREISFARDRYEKEMAATRGQLELEVLNLKASHSKEITAKTSQISALENSVNSLSKEKSTLFDQLQMRQAELESSQLHLDSLQSQITELQYQLRESNDRLALLEEELADARRERDKIQEPATSTQEVARLLSAAESKYESKIAELRKHIDSLEKDRNEIDADWSGKLRERTQEVDQLKASTKSFGRTREENEAAVTSLKTEIERLQGHIQSQEKRIIELQFQSEGVQEVEDSARRQLDEYNSKIASLQQQIEELKSREVQLRTSNKTLRDELRKVQSSAALLEKQRNPGVGYWSSRIESSAPESRISVSSSNSDTPSRTASPRPGSPSNPSDEEINIEYLRNVILQFLEHKEMRPHLVRVLSIILHFTPQETRRLVAKV